MDARHYVHFTTDDFAVDPAFRKWCLRSDQETQEFWGAFLIQHPSKAEAIEQARRIVREADQYFSQKKASEHQLEDAYRRTLQAARQQRPPVPIRVRDRSLPTAAAVALLIAATAVLGYLVLAFTGEPTLTEYRTEYGQQRTIRLPDGSTVQLNANSSLTLDEHWEADTRREVWLEGEAYFSVEKKPATQAKFVVHTQELNVEVLGTQFNVNTKEKTTQVTLDEGKIKLSIADDSNTQTVTMAPGETASYSELTHQINKQTTDTRAYSTWKDGYLTYQEATLAEVLQDVHDTFGYTVVVKDSLLLDETITGALSAQDLNALLVVLEDIIPKISFAKNDKQLIVTSRE